MKKTLLVVFALLSTQLFAQLNIQFRSNIPYGAFPATANIGGYVDHSGHEYALLGWANGLDIIDVTNPDTPVVKFSVPGNQSEWREVKTYRDYAYVTTEQCCDGLQIVDLSNLPASINTTTYTGDGGIAGMIQTIHALHIDTAKAYLYLYGSNVQQHGATNHGYPLFLDISDPLNPHYMGEFIAPTGNPYVHDGYVQNDTAYFGHIYDGYVSIVDLSNKSNPVLLATQQTPNAFTHNTWLSDDHHTMFTTDETTNSFLTAYDISNLGNITELSRFQTDPGSGTIVHNTHILNDYAITSWYTEGVVIVDESRPKNPIEVGHYDTYPANNNGVFDGDWGVYPFLPSGNIVCSDMSNGLFVLTPTYVRGCYLEGIVTDSITTIPLSGVTVTILTSTSNHLSNLTGNYYTGTATAGMYDVQFSKNGYYSKTITGVTLNNGVLTNLDVQLVCINCVALSGQVIEAGTANPIANAQIVFSDGTTTQTFYSDALGNFSLGNFIGGTYDVVAGMWGYHTNCQNILVDGSTSPLIITLDRGYYDDFSLDFGWTTATAGPNGWVRAVPVQTMDGNAIANPGVDDATDCLDLAYVTDNGGGGPFDHDVDPSDGYVILTSPLFDLTTYGSPELDFDRWWYDGNSQNGTPNDTLLIRLTNGITTVTLETNLHTSTSMSQWVPKVYTNLNSLIAPTANMQLIVRTSDPNPGNVVEAGLDKFQVIDNGVGVNELSASSLHSFPNPFTNVMMIDGSALKGKNNSLEVYNSLGEKIFSSIANNGSSIRINTAEWSTGIYFVRLSNEDSVTNTLIVSKVN